MSEGEEFPLEVSPAGLPRAQSSEDDSAHPTALEKLALPEDVSLVRTTNRFDSTSVPKGLLSAHKVAPGVWGVLRVLEGEVTFELEETGLRRRLSAGELQVIEPDTLHHVEPGPSAEFEISFHRAGDPEG